MTVKISPRRGEPIARVLRRLRKLVDKEGIRQDLARHATYKSDQVRRRGQRWKNNGRKAWKAL